MLTAKQFLNRKSQILEAALCHRACLDRIESHFKEDILDEMQRQYPTGTTLREVMHLCAREQGESRPSGLSEAELFRAAFGQSSISAAASFSTLSLSGILSNVANKFMTLGFTSVEGGWRAVAAIRGAKDYKQMNIFALAADTTYKRVGNAGEVESGSLGEVAYTNRVDDYGLILTVPRQDVLNDDINSLTQVPKNLGAGAGRALSRVVWTTFLANVNTLFTTGNNNLISGGGSALSAASLGSALALAYEQTTPDGEPLAIPPSFLLCPPALAQVANALAHQTLIVSNASAGLAGETGSPSTTPDVNPWRNLITPVISSYLSNSNYPGYSATAWYLLSDPKALACLEVAFLHGAQSPTVEHAAADFDTLGIRMRGTHSFGCGIGEYRAAVRSAGA